MFSRQILLLVWQRTLQPSRTLALRHCLQRRSASGVSPPLTGAADNAFNRERLAVKAHAAKSSGTGLLIFWGQRSELLS